MLQEENAVVNWSQLKGNVARLNLRISHISKHYLFANCKIKQQKNKELKTDAEKFFFIIIFCCYLNEDDKRLIYILCKTTF